MYLELIKKTKKKKKHSRYVEHFILKRPTGSLIYELGVLAAGRWRHLEIVPTRAGEEETDLGKPARPKLDSCTSYTD